MQFGVKKGSKSPMSNLLVPAPLRAGKVLRLSFVAPGDSKKSRAQKVIVFAAQNVLLSTPTCVCSQYVHFGSWDMDFAISADQRTFPPIG
jgi:hypothetical protein